jgi:hypothetical protein
MRSLHYLNGGTLSPFPTEPEQYWFLGRPTVEDLRQDLRVVTRKCRPDWDITTPELRAAWKEGRKELFYPYGKTYVQTLGEQD